MSGSITLWDEQSDPKERANEVWCWRSYASGDRVVSVPRYLEDHAERLRARYLAFIHDLGDRRISGQRVVDHLERNAGFSYWWMTQLAEKSPFKSPRIYCCLRLLALEEMLRARPPSALTLVSADRELGLAIRKLCENFGIVFIHSRPKRSPTKWSLRRVYNALPFPMQGAISMARHLAGRWHLRRNGTPPWFAGENATSLFSYFIHLDQATCSQGRFYSRQWGVLPELLHEQGKRTNWIHHFFVSPAVPSTDTALEWVGRFNSDASRQGYHAFVDSYLGPKVLARALRDWFWLAARSWRLRNLRDTFVAGDSSAWLWPLLRADWLTSMCGPVAMSNCLWVALFDAALAGMPRQERGFYLYESQAWERAMLHAWRKHGHGEIIGVQHATVPFWHLYYFDDPRTWNADQRCPKLLPDRLAVNGALPHRTFVIAGFPADRIEEVEALRYFNLGSLRAGAASAAGRSDHLAHGRSGDRRVKVLVLGDMIPETMTTFLRMVEGAVPMLPPSYDFTFKPHPGYSFRLADYPGLRADETTEGLDKILAQYDFAVSANSTSAACDAYIARLPVVIALDGRTLNLSPLRGQPGVSFVSSSKELAESLTPRRGGHAAGVRSGDLFFLDPKLPRWRRLLDGVVSLGQVEL